MPNPSTQIHPLEHYCLTDNNFVLAQRGKEVLQIRPSEFLFGDKLPALTKEGRLTWAPAECRESIHQAGKDLAVINTQNGLLEVTPGHKLFLDNGQLVAAGNLVAGQALRVVQHRLPMFHAKPIGVPLAFVLGAYAAEGTSLGGLNKYGTGQWKIEFCLGYSENIFAQDIISSLNAVFPYIPRSRIQVHKYLQYGRQQVGIYSKKLVEDFKVLGALGHCWEKRTPPSIFTATIEEKAAYISALLIGDGTFKKRTIVLKLTSKALIDGCHILLSSIGIDSRLGHSLAYRGQKQNRDVYFLRIYGKETLSRFLGLHRGFLRYWHWFNKLKEYASSKDGNIKYQEEEIKDKLLELAPCSLASFVKQSGIGQRVITRIYGSWNRCLRANRFPVKRGRWGAEYSPRKQPKTYGVRAGGRINTVKIVQSQRDTTVYDFTIPLHENFLINTIVSHNSGTQASIYIGDIWIDEAVAIRYEVSQRKTPIYAYASQLFDTVAPGPVIVEGGLAINFKEAGYLWVVLNRYRQLQGAIEQAAPTSPLITTANVNLLRGGLPPDLQERIDKIIRDGGTLAEQTSLYRDLAEAAARNKQRFQEIAARFEEEVWGLLPGKERALDTFTGRRADSNFFDDIDIFITYGDVINAPERSTVRRIKGVHFTSTSQSVESDGNPILEHYSFLARDIV